MSGGAANTRAPDGWTQKARGVWALTHPGPSLVTALAYALFAALAAHWRPNPTRLVITVVGMIALQFAISALNDYRDRDDDATSQKFKPLARGILPPWVALAVAALCVAIMVACYAPYGPMPLLLAGAFLALGVAYDLGLKSTPLGAVMMGLAFPLLPMLAWEVFATLKHTLYWTFPIGLAIGVAIHIADALPDVEADRAVGARTLAVTLGQHAHTAQIASLAFANLLIVVLAVSGLTPSHPAPLMIAISLVAILLALDGILYRLKRAPSSLTYRANMIIVILVSLITASAWIISAIL